jgi:ankyrin repeat protein
MNLLRIVSFTRQRATNMSSQRMFVTRQQQLFSRPIVSRPIISRNISSMSDPLDMYESPVILKQIIKYRNYDLISNFKSTLLNKLQDTGDSVLHTAVKEQNYELVEILLRNGADKYKRNSLGDDCYDIVTAKGDLEMFKLLAKFN